VPRQDFGTGGKTFSRNPIDLRGSEVTNE